MTSAREFYRVLYLGDLDRMVEIAQQLPNLNFPHPDNPEIKGPLVASVENYTNPAITEKLLELGANPQDPIYLDNEGNNILLRRMTNYTGDAKDYGTLPQLRQVWDMLREKLGLDMSEIAQLDTEFDPTIVFQEGGPTLNRFDEKALQIIETMGVNPGEISEFLLILPDLSEENLRPIIMYRAKILGSQTPQKYQHRLMYLLYLMLREEKRRNMNLPTNDMELKSIDLDKILKNAAKEEDRYLYPLLLKDGADPYDGFSDREPISVDYDDVLKDIVENEMDTKSIEELCSNPQISDVFISRKAIMAGIDPRYRTKDEICDQLREMGSKNKEEILNQLIPDVAECKEDRNTLLTKFSDLTPLMVTGYESNGMVWCFSVEEVPNLLQTETNPFNREKLPREFLFELQNMRELFEWYGIPLEEVERDQAFEYVFEGKKLSGDAPTTAMITERVMVDGVSTVVQREVSVDPVFVERRDIVIEALRRTGVELNVMEDAFTREDYEEILNNLTQDTPYPANQTSISRESQEVGVKEFISKVGAFLQQNPDFDLRVSVEVDQKLNPEKYRENVRIGQLYRIMRSRIGNALSHKMSRLSHKDYIDIANVMYAQEEILPNSKFNTQDRDYLLGEDLDDLRDDFLQVVFNFLELAPDNINTVREQVNQKYQGVVERYDPFYDRMYGGNFRQRLSELVNTRARFDKLADVFHQQSGYEMYIFDGETVQDAINREYIGIAQDMIDLQEDDLDKFGRYHLGLQNAMTAVELLTNVSANPTEMFIYQQLPENRKDFFEILRIRGEWNLYVQKLQECFSSRFNFSSLELDSIDEENFWNLILRMIQTGISLEDIYVCLISN